MTDFPETQSLLLANIQSLENREAWEQFLLLYRPVIYRMARRRGLQDSDAQDLAQEVLLRIAKSIESWEARPNVRFRHWLRNVANNAILTALKTSNRQPVVGGSLTDLLADQPEEDALSEELQYECLREQYQRASDRLGLRSYDCFYSYLPLKVGAHAADQPSVGTANLSVQYL